jgi:hypothetical protein
MSSGFLSASRFAKDSFVIILDTKLLFVFAILFFGFFRFETGINGENTPAAAAIESDIVLLPELATILPESFDVGRRATLAFTNLARVPAIRGKGVVAIGLGCVTKGSDGCGGGIHSVNCSLRVYIPSLATKLSVGLVTRLGESIAAVNPRATNCCSRS